MAELKKEENEIKTYYTNANICIVGRAICIDLNDANLIGNVKNYHMTIFFRKGERWNDNEIIQMTKSKNLWMKENKLNDNSLISFSIEKWGNQSMKVLGNLKNLCEYLRENNKNMSNEIQRIPHVECFKKIRKEKDRKDKEKEKEKKKKIKKKLNKKKKEKKKKNEK